MHISKHSYRIVSVIWLMNTGCIKTQLLREHGLLVGHT